ncbi:hypothetical protein [Chitinophaga sp.]|uniref:hypothetical protein n=1 Tax=Chitinophaga sp. TaxID=1869181 RepID=UPI0031D6B306
MVTYQADPYAFHVFYIVFFNVFLEREVLQGDPEAGSLKSPKNWAIKGNDKKYRALGIFGGQINNPHYFYKIKSESKITGEDVPVNAEAIGKALIYLGYRLKTDQTDKGKNIYSKRTAHDRFMLFVDDYRNIIERIRNAEDAIQKDRITKKYVSFILKKNEPQIVAAHKPTARFLHLNGKYRGVHIQGSFEPEDTELELFTGDHNNITGVLTMHYKADGKNPAGSVALHVSGKYFSEEHVALIYWNPDASVVQNGVIRLTQSGNKRELNGHFWGYYDPVPESRGICEGTLFYSKVE